MHSSGRFNSDEGASRATACALLGATIQLTTRWLVCRPDESIDETLSALHFIYAAVIKAEPPCQSSATFLKDGNDVLAQVS
jgi:hypothetical protein